MQKFPQKLSAQRTAKGPITISECCADGEYIIIENTSKRNDVNMTNWVLTHCVGSVRKVSFKFPESFILKSKQTVKLWASSRNSATNNSSNNNNQNNRFSCGKGSFSSCSSSLSSSSSSLSSKSVSGSLNSSNTNSSYFKDAFSSQPNFSSNLGCTNSLSSSSGNETLTCSDSIENELVLYDIENWTCGAQEMFIRLENEFGEEKACFRKTN